MSPNTTANQTGQSRQEFRPASKLLIITSVSTFVGFAFLYLARSSGAVFTPAGLLLFLLAFLVIFGLMELVKPKKSIIIEKNILTYRKQSIDLNNLKR